MYTVDTGDIIGGTKVSQKENIGKVKIYGAELPVKYYSGDLSLAASYAWSESEIMEGYSGAAALEGRALTYSPRQTFSGSIGLKADPVYLTLGWMYKSKQYTQDDNSAYVRGYHTFSASVTREFTPAVTARLSFENIFNKLYQESSSDLAPGRTVTTSIEAKF